MPQLREIKVSVAGRDYEIPQLKIRASATWQAEVESDFGAIGGLMGLIGQATGDSFAEIQQQVKIPEVAAAVAKLQGMIMQSMGRVRALVYSYAPLLAADKDFIEENGYNDEIVAVFMKLLRFEYPLGELVRLFAGAIQRQTMQNSPSANGESPTTQAISG